MDTFQFSPTQYTFNAFALFIIGLAGMVYLFRLKEKTPAIYLVILAITGFTVGMMSWFATGIVFWGGALFPFVDACAVVSMAGVIVFSYQYPKRVDSLEARIVSFLAILVGTVALLTSLVYAVRYITEQGIAAWTLPTNLNPIVSIATLIVCLRRTFVLQSEQGVEKGWRSVSALWHPQTRPIRVLRNFSLAIFIGMIQGIATVIESFVTLPATLVPLLINLSFSLMFIIVVYSVFDLTTEQPRLVVRLVGLSLATVLGISGVVGMYVVEMTNQNVNEQLQTAIALTQHELVSGNVDALPTQVAYLIELQSSESTTEKNILYTALNVDTSSLLKESTIAPSWGYPFSFLTLCTRGENSSSLKFRYGSHSIGSYYQYVGCLVNEAGTEYEVGFSLDGIRQVVQAESNWAWSLILVSSLLILVVFPRFFHTNLIHPLERLLDGVRQVDGGDLDVQVPVSYQDEIGFLTSAFNKMTRSLKEELIQRQRAETELRQLNLTLEQRVADRTRELEALYEVSSAASQAQDSASLMNILLERSISALRCSAGIIFLMEDSALGLVTSRGFSSDWLTHLVASLPTNALLSDAIQEQNPLLIPDLSREVRAPDFMRADEPLTMLLASLSANGETLGLLCLARNASQSFDLDEVALLVSIVSQVETAVHTDQLRQLAQRATVLEERDRLARDLHDSVTQSLYGLATLTEAGKLRLESGDVQASAHLMTRIGQTTRQAIREMRLFLHQLRPSVLESEGLIGALELRLAAVEGRSDVKATLDVDESIRLPLQVENAFYHIVQEALNNALKHASATVVSVRMARLGHGVLLEVKDNGCGFDLEQVDGGGMGLDNMRARAKEIHAVLEIHSIVGEGTCVKVQMEGRV